MNYSNWRQDLSEVMSDKDDNKKVTEKNIKNKIKINPMLGETIQAMGGELIDMVEMMDPNKEKEQQEKEKPDPKEKKISQVKKQVLMKKMQAVRQGAGADIVAHHEPEGEQIEEKKKSCAHTLKGIFCPVHGMKDCPDAGKEMKCEAVYGGEPEKKKDTRMVVTAADKKANTKAYQNYKAGDKRYKAADHMKENESFVLEREDSPYEKSSDKALDKKYGYGTSHDKGPKTGFGRASNRATAAAVIKDIRRRKSKSTPETRADAAHKGWSHTARTSADQTPEKKATRKKLADTPYKKLPKDEQEKDQVAADAVKKEYDKRKASKKFKESTEDSLRDRRMERGGVDGNVDYRRPPAQPNLAGKKKPKKDGPSAMDIVKAQIRAKHGKGAIIDTKKK